MISIRWNVYIISCRPEVWEIQGPDSRGGLQKEIGVTVLERRYGKQLGK